MGHIKGQGFALIASLLVVSVNAEGGQFLHRTFQIPDTVNGLSNSDLALDGHVISSPKIRSKSECTLYCLAEPECVSVNLGMVQGSWVCELNNRQDVDGEFVTKHGFRYIQMVGVDI